MLVGGKLSRRASLMRLPCAAEGAVQRGAGHRGLRVRPGGGGTAGFVTREHEVVRVLESRRWLSPEAAVCAFPGDARAFPRAGKREG